MKRLFYTPYTEDVEKYVIDSLLQSITEKSDYKILYLTPTMFLYRRRLNRFQVELKIASKKRNVQVPEHLSDHLQIYEFDQWTRELVYRMANETPLSRTESHVLIKRAIENTFPNRMEWIAESHHLLDLFDQIDTTNLSVEELADISSYNDWQGVILIYKAYLDLLLELQVESFGQCLKRLINSDLLNQYDEVIFDGPFLFFRPVQELLMERMDTMGRWVTYIVPYHRFGEEINPSLEVIEKVYSNYVPIHEWKPIGKRFEAGSTDLHQLRSALFTDRTIKYSGSLSIHTYSTIEEEIRNVIRTAKNLISTKESLARNVVIVAPDAMRLRPLVREITEQEQIEVEIPQRPLLGLTAGEFIQFIYETKWNEKKFNASSYLDTSMFKRILVSGWFPFAEDSIEAFQAVEDVFFKRCVSLEDWSTKITDLQNAIVKLSDEEFNYHPLNAVTDFDLEAWSTIIWELQQLQEELCSLTGSVHDHLVELSEQLNVLADRYGFNQSEFGKNFLDRLALIVDQSAAQQRIEVQAVEFRSALTQLLIETEEESFEQNNSNAKNKVTVTGLENVSYLQYKYLFMINFTQEKYPLLLAQQWPLLDDLEWKFITTTTKLKVNSLREWEALLASREKYYFYISFYVPNIEMHISYSRTLDGQPQYPSHYLFDLARAFNIYGENTKQLIEGLEGYRLLTNHDFIGETSEYQIPEATFQMKYTPEPILHIDELAVYRLCPRRFYYGKKYPNKNVYETSFQFERYMANELAKYALKSLFEQLSSQDFRVDLESLSVRDKIITQELDRHIDNARQQLAVCFPVDEELWKNAIYYTRIVATNIINLIFDGHEVNRLKSSGRASAEVSFAWNPEPVTVQLVQGRTTYTIVGSRELETQFSKKQKTFSISHYPHFLNMSSYDDRDGDDPFTKWFYNIKSKFGKEQEWESVIIELEELVRKITANEYSKRTGEHCRYCPFERDCQQVSTQDP